MQVALAEKMSRELMNAHGLEDWGFGFDRGTRRLGATHINLRKITLSKKFVKLNKWGEVQETMLHEIAHAITGDGHTMRWKKMYASIGGNPNRNYANMVSAHKIRPLVKGHCPSCNRQVQARIRSRVACRNCCIDYNHGRFSSEYLIAWEPKS